ncbi:MAG: hypothetical protein ABIP85_04485 [Chthoniobacteraceae bacterium]
MLVENAEGMVIQGRAGEIQRFFTTVLFQVAYAHSRAVERIIGMSDHISIAAFDDEQSAKALAVRMSKEGVEAISSNDSAEQLLMFWNPHPRGEHHVLVPGQQLEAALQWLSRLDANDTVLLSAIRCPDCRSTQVEYPQFSRKTIVGSLPAIGAALGIIERQFYCTACHFTWSPTKTPAKSGSP